MPPLQIQKDEVKGDPQVSCLYTDILLSGFVAPGIALVLSQRVLTLC